MKEKDYDIATDMLLDLKCDLVRESLLKIINALRFAKWEEPYSYGDALATEYKETSIFIDLGARNISYILVTDEIEIRIYDDGEVEPELFTNETTWTMFITHLEDFLNSRDALEVENTKKIVNKILELGDEKWRTL